MKKRFLLCAITVCFAGAVRSQQPVTTFILVRHAEKTDDGTRNPDLSEAGRARALALAALLHETRIDAIYSTPYLRTRNTVLPLAEAKQLPLQDHEPNQPGQLDELLRKYRGGTVVICGHSNTTPWIANYFLGTDRFEKFPESDYDNVLVLSVVERGQAAVTFIQYGAASRP